jgi:hypothetical protein
VSAEALAAVIGLMVLITVVALRGVTAGRHEIRLADVAIATVPILLWLVVSGRIQKLVVGAEGITVETTRQAILTASAKPIAEQVATLPVEPVQTGPKGEAAHLPELVSREVQGLDFVIGSRGYGPEAVEQYLLELTKYPFFRYVIVRERDGSLFGIIDARKLTTVLQGRRLGLSWGSFTEMLNRGSADDRQQMARLPGFIAAGTAVTPATGKRQVLERMETLGAEWLPVVNANRMFIGVVERSRLTASLILDVSAQLQTRE